MRLAIFDCRAHLLKFNFNAESSIDRRCKLSILFFMIIRNAYDPCSKDPSRFSMSRISSMCMRDPPALSSREKSSISSAPSRLASLEFYMHFTESTRAVSSSIFWQTASESLFLKKTPRKLSLMLLKSSTWPNSMQSCWISTTKLNATFRHHLLQYHAEVNPLRFNSLRIWYFSLLLLPF